MHNSRPECPVAGLVVGSIGGRGSAVLVGAVRAALSLLVVSAAPPAAAVTVVQRPSQGAGFIHRGDGRRSTCYGLSAIQSSRKLFIRSIFTERFISLAIHGIPP